MHMNAHADANGLYLSCIVFAGFGLALPEEKPTVNNEIVTYLGKHLRVDMTTKSAAVCWTESIIGLY